MMTVRMASVQVLMTACWPSDSIDAPTALAGELGRERIVKESVGSVALHGALHRDHEGGVGDVLDVDLGHGKTGDDAASSARLQGEVAAALCSNGLAI